MVRDTGIGIVEFRRRLSALVEAAWRQPLSLTRYGRPWVWVLSDDTWQRHRALLPFSPGRHPLARIRMHVDAHLQPEPLHRALAAHGLALPAGPLFRALILHALYAFASVACLHEQIAYNRLFHWFVMSGEGDVAWAQADLAAGLRALRAEPDAVALIDATVRDMPLGDLAERTGLAIDRAWACAWRSRPPFRETA